MIEFEEDGVPIGWQDVVLTEVELDAMCDALEYGDVEFAERIVERAYDRLYANVESFLL